MQAKLSELGTLGQKKIRTATVAIVGLGGLGCPTALNLGAIGIGRLILTDGDSVAESNLGRQYLYTPQDIGSPKVSAAAHRVNQQNPDVEIETVSEYVTGSTLESLSGLFNDADVIVDCADNLALTYLLQEFCVDQGIVFVSGSVERFEARLFTYANFDEACFGCAFPEADPTAVAACEDFGVLSTTTSVLGAMQATEAIKAIANQSTNDSALTVINTLNHESHKFGVERRDDCKICGVQQDRVERMEIKEIEPTELKAKLDAGEDIVVVDVRNQDEWDEANLSEAASSILIPLPELEERFSELDPSKTTIVHCRSGGRSAKATEFLMNNGFSDVRNLIGGIHRWADDIDPLMAKP